ncbi:MAG: hypothetical protein KAY24_06015 [Candidatus Eisenbacteria sp.]|nr:hypothetical protein [Candidatus Eisenbacteria bacterium]
MRKIVVTLALLALVAAPVLADNTARVGYHEGTYHEYDDQISGRATALIASVLEGVFTDQAAIYQTSLEAAGHSVDIVYDPAGAWPDLAPYSLILVTTADNWWGGTWTTGDETVLGGFLDGGGDVIFMSQDYLYFRPGGHIGFPMDYLGVCGVVMDPAFGAVGDLSWEGIAGGLLDGQSGVLPGAVGTCFESNGFFSDEIMPCIDGLNLWTQPEVGPFPFMEGGCVTENTVFNTFDYSCDPTGAQCDLAIGTFVDYFGGQSPVEASSWGAIKGMFR